MAEAFCLNANAYRYDIRLIPSDATGVRDSLW